MTESPKASTPAEPGSDRSELLRGVVEALLGELKAGAADKDKRRQVEEWMRSLAYGSLFSRWSVRIVNELDRCSREAQDLLLTYLDRLPPGRALLGTSNLQLDLLTERFQTRFQAVKLLPPETEELADFLIGHWSVPRQTALQIAVGSCGCVRAALADLESWLDCRP